MRTLLIAEIPDELAHAWNQHVRNFDAAHPGCEFKMMSYAADMTTAELIDSLKLEPPLPELHVFERKNTDEQR